MVHELIPGIRKLIAEMTAAMYDVLRKRVAGPRRTGRQKQVIVKTYGKRGLLPAVDLDDTGSMLDLMESSGDPTGH